MQLILLNLLPTQELINDMLSHIQALWLQTEFAMHVYNPLQQESSRSVSDLCLYFVDVFRVNHKFKLLLLHVFVILLRVLSN